MEIIEAMRGTAAGLGSIISLLSFVCWIIILIDAFKTEVWKGVLGLLCFFYLLYYAVAEFRHKYKGLIVFGWLLGLMFGGGAYFGRGLLFFF